VINGGTGCLLRLFRVSSLTLKAVREMAVTCACASASFLFQPLNSRFIGILILIV
jgi:hypothetical protein